MKWEDVTEPRQLSKVSHHTSLGEVYDLSWSADSTHIAIAALHEKVRKILCGNNNNNNSNNYHHA